MSPTYSSQDLLSFLDWAASKGLLKQATAQSRKVSTQRVLRALDESERQDVRTIDRETAFVRFVNKEGSSFTPDSLATYRSRFYSALDDFLRYRDNPAGFKFSPPKKAPANGGNQKGKSSPGEKAKGSASPTRGASAAEVAETPQGRPQATSEFVFPIPIREGMVVRIHNLPANLTKAEAQRISAVVLALAVDDK